jgi:ubiquinone/menaquinone biosynthesis C-methylase UbiE
VKREHPVFACFYEAMSRPAEWLGAKSGMNRMRSRLVAKLGGRILEVGAGNGMNFVHYAKGAEVVGIEPDWEMLRRAIGRAHRARARVSLVAADGEELPFASGSFDAVVSCLVLCTVPDARRALSEMRRVLKANGELHFVEHVRARPGWLASIQDALAPAWTRVFAGCHPNRDTKSAIEAAGFRIETVKEGAGGMMIRGRALAV